MSHKFKGLLFALLIVAVLFIGLFSLIKFKLPEIITYSVKRTLHDYGVETVDGGDPYISIKSIGSNSLFVSGRYDTINYNVTLTDIQVAYQLAALIYGKLESITIENLQADISIIPSDSEQAVSEVDLLEVRSALASFYAPIERVFVETLTININCDDENYLLSGRQLKLQNSMQALTGILRLHAESPFVGDINEMKIQLSQSDFQPWLPDIALALSSESLTGLDAAIRWKQSESIEHAIAADISGSLQLVSVNKFLSLFDINLPDDLFGQVMAEISMDTAFNGEWVLPQKIDQQWLASSEVNGEASALLSIQQPNGSQLIVEVKAECLLPMASKEWQFNGKLGVSDWDVNSIWQVGFDDNAFSLASSVELSNLPRLIDGLAIFNRQLLELKLASGMATIDLEYLKGDSPGTRVKLSASELSGIYQNVAFSDATLHAPLIKTDSWRSLGEIELSAALVSSGVTLDNLQAKLLLKNATTLTDTHWQLMHLEAGLLSGHIALANPVAFDYPFIESTFPVEILNVRLDDLLALYAEQGIQGTGALSGLIPITLSDDGVKIEGGKLLNTGSGKISYRSDTASAVSNEQLAMTLRLLEDFNYQKLAVGVTFEPSGKLLLSSQLSGNNPGEFEGRQVNFNINLEDNLFDLFKVLKLTDDLTRGLEKRLKQ